MDLKVTPQLTVASFVAVNAGFAATLASMQTMLTPDSTFVPLGVVVTLWVTAIGATGVVLRTLWRLEKHNDLARRERHFIARKAGVTEQELKELE